MTGLQNYPILFVKIKHIGISYFYKSPYDFYQLIHKVKQNDNDINYLILSIRFLGILYTDELSRRPTLKKAKAILLEGCVRVRDSSRALC